MHQATKGKNQNQSGEQWISGTKHNNKKRPVVALQKAEQYANRALWGEENI